MDEIVLEDLVFFGRHGANPEETSLGQRFGVDLTLRLDLSRAGSSDDLSDTVSYATVYKVVRAELEGEPSKLLEHLAARVLRAVLGLDQRISEARLKLTKLNPPIKGAAVGRVSVVMQRDRKWLG
jgi:dihydroneopterin aldolase